jgi:LuxR family transcriptional regulator, maltose regulon positive regulatory protein
MRFAPAGIGEATAPIGRLTQREEEVLSLITLGKCNKEIAAAMGISPRTVAFHLANVFVKFGATSRLELLAKVVVRQK